ncbi:MAG TPA: efflux RND transporter periplasmic adaptor subunit, partial [Dongiaceae bacterium]
ANNDNKLWPGAFVNLRVLLQTRENALTIPSAAVQRGPDGLFTYVVKPDATVEPRAIKVALDTGQLAVVDGGLTPGDQVVTGGQYRLQPGSRVQAKQVASNPAAAPGPAVPGQAAAASIKPPRG